MQKIVGLERCFSFINCQLQPGRESAPGIEPSGCTAITISRQAGCGARVIADKLAALLQSRSPTAAPPWTVFDRNLMERVLEDHQLPKRIAKFLPEDRMTELQDISDELFGLRPASWTIVRQTAETILKLAELGRVILIGRGSTVVTAKLPQVFHVRLIAPLEDRIEHAREYYDMSAKAAREFCLSEDAGRRRYMKKYYSTNIEDPLLYHLIINTGLISYDDAAKLIADAAAFRR